MPACTHVCLYMYMDICSIHSLRIYFCIIEKKHMHMNINVCILCVGMGEFVCMQWRLV